MMLLLSLLLPGVWASGQQETIPWEGMEGEINLLLERYQAVGLSVAVVKGEDVLYSVGFGHRDSDRKLPVTANTVFPIGSITKSFTGTLLGIAESEQRLSLKDKPALYLPQFQFYNDNMNDLIAIEDLLSHRSGIGNQGTSEVFFPNDDKLTVVQRLRYLPPQDEVKNSFSYSNMGYTLAGAVLEQCSKQSWEQNLEERLIGPLQMSNTFTSLDKTKATENFALGYGIHQGAVEKTAYQRFYSQAPAGAIKSSVNDLSHWMIAWLNQGQFAGRQVIPEAYIRKATSLQNVKEESYEKDSFLNGEGFGWRLRASYGHFRVGHGGNTTGFSSITYLFPFEKLGIVVLCNQDNSYLPYMVADLIVRKMLGQAPMAEYPVVVNDLYRPDPESSGYNEAKMPTHAPEAFVGAYEAEGYGSIEVVEEGEALFAVFPTYRLRLEHRHYNQFYLEGTKDFDNTFDPGFAVEFVVDREGKIEALEIHSQREPVVFERRE
ncbi:MAG: serine hydrolase [Bacteroidota bacterium]